MKSEDEFRKMVEAIKVALTNSSLLGQQRDDKWLRTLYDSYTNRFIHDNTHIWMTGSIMIPLAVSAFALLPTIEKPSVPKILPVAIASSMVLLAWNLIADNQRGLLEKSFAWLRAIEELLGVDSPLEHKLKEGFLMRVVVRRRAVRTVRWALFFLIVIAWLVVLMTWPH